MGGCVFIRASMINITIETKYKIRTSKKLTRLKQQEININESQGTQKQLQKEKSKGNIVKKKKKKNSGQAPVAHTCNPS
jgi:hypothetical protein